MKTSHAPHRVTLPRALSKLGIASRSQAYESIIEGKVRVNGNRELNPHRWVNLLEDRIEVEGKKQKPMEDRYILFHKPKGVTTTRVNERGGSTIYDVLGDDTDALIPVGRLDKDTTGLLLLTNDHRLADFLTSPRSGVEKSYLATVNFPVSKNHITELTKGVQILVDGKPWTAKATKAKLVRPTQVEISISEGKNRQVRKMFEAVGYVVLELKRVSLGPLALGSLKEAQKRDLSKEEVSSLKDLMRNRRSASSHSERRRRQQRQDRHHA